MDDHFRKLKQVRDYIHVMDLADGHIAALRKLFADPKIGNSHTQFTGYRV